MGMDGVELVMAVEEAFDIRIEDAEAERLLTPRQLIDLVMEKVANVETGFCLSQRAFNLLRRHMVQRLGFKRHEITPTARLSNLIPKQHRKEFFRECGAQLGSGAAPTLVAPGWFHILMVVFAFSAGAAAAVPMARRLGPEFAMLFFLVVAAMAGVAGMLLSRSIANEFPAKRFRRSASCPIWIRRNKPDLAVKQQTAWTRDQVAARVREATIKVLGCEQNYSEDARFVQDLGLS